MLWYDNYYSGVGRATYSGFDESTSLLWIYEYAAQHDKLWEPGDRPTGIDFSTVNPPQNPTHNNAMNRSREVERIWDGE